MSIKYKLDAFEGPLDLLLHLIDKNELDIYDIPIVQITEQYLGYIREMPQLELEVTTEFLVMAATLLSIKSKMLLPKPPALDETSDLPEEDPRFELVQRLLEYRKFKDLADRLKDRELARSLIFSREPIDFNQYAPEQVDDPLKGLSLADIMFTFQNVVKRTIVKNRVAKIQRDERSVKDQINKLLGYFQKEGDRMMFSAILEDEFERENIVVTFLAILELMKMRRITCFQHDLFEDIVIQYRGGEEAVDGIESDEIDY
jgi:segregation and condensation protein A